MFQRQPLIDAIIGPQMYQNLSNILLDEFNKKNVLLDFNEEEKFSKLGTKRNYFFYFFFYNNSRRM